jgi:hypothetical protein
MSAREFGSSTCERVPLQRQSKLRAQVRNARRSVIEAHPLVRDGAEASRRHR